MVIDMDIEDDVDFSALDQLEAAALRDRASNHAQTPLNDGLCRPLASLSVPITTFLSLGAWQVHAEHAALVCRPIARAQVSTMDTTSLVQPTTESACRLRPQSAASRLHVLPQAAQPPLASPTGALRYIFQARSCNTMQ
jgi:hypothetical protein